MTREQIEQSIYESETCTDLDLEFSGLFSEKENEIRKGKVNNFNTQERKF